MVHLVFKHPPRVSEPPEHVLNMLDTLLGEVESLREELSVNTESGRSGSADTAAAAGLERLIQSQHLGKKPATGPRFHKL